MLAERKYRSSKTHPVRKARNLHNLRPIRTLFHHHHTYSHTYSHTYCHPYTYTHTSSDADAHSYSYIYPYT